MKKLKKIFKLSILSLTTLLIILSSTYADSKEIEYTFENSLSSLIESGEFMEQNWVFKSPERVIEDTYWADLEKIEINDNDNKSSIYYGVFPKYLTNPNESSLKDYGFAYPNVRIACSGISPSKFGMRMIGPLDFYRYGIWVGEKDDNKDTYAPPNKGKQYTDTIPEYVNPFKFKEEDLLSKDEIADASKLITLADLKKKDSNDSKNIDKLGLGDELNLDFSINSEWSRRLINGLTLSLTRTGYDSVESINNIYNNTKIKLDSGFAFTIDLPDDIEAKENKIKAKIDGLKIENKDYFDVESKIITEKQNDKDKKVLVLTLKLKDDIKNNSDLLWKEMVEKLNKLDLKNIKISISGLKVSQNARVGENITLRATASGFIDAMNSDWEDGRIENPSSFNSCRRVYIYFAAVQDPAGLDEAALKDKPNLISYTFKVKAGEVTPTPQGPSVTYPDTDMDKGDTKTVIPEIKDKKGEPTRPVTTPEVVQPGNGVVVTPHPDGSITVTIPEDYDGPSTIVIPVVVTVDGEEIHTTLTIRVRDNKPGIDYDIPELKIHEYTPTYPVFASVDKKVVDKEVINSHDQYIFGYPDDTIRPDGDMTRAEAIAVVARLQKLDLSDKSSKLYKDTKADMWYNGAINAAFREGYLLEKEGENIRPNDKITRAELAELISHIDKKNNAVAPFDDVKGHKFEAAINQAYGNERIKGYPDGTFKPDNTITRAEVATMLNKLYDRYPDKNFIDANQNLVHNYKDMSYKGHWGYYELVEAYHSHTYLRLKDNMEEWKVIIK